MLNFFQKLGKFITVLRIGLLNVFFLFFLVILLVVIFSTPGPDPIPKQTPLYLSFNGYLVDKVTYEANALDILTNNIQDHEIVVRDVVYAINSAANDTRVTSLVLDLSGLIGGGFSKMEEIGQAVEVFKQSGKAVYAYSDSYSQQQYYLASYADTVYINELGTVALTGFGIYRNYSKDATDKLSIKFHVFRVGDYKDAIEPYIRNSMSKDSREHNSNWLNQLWTRYTTKIQSLRDLPEGSVEKFIQGIATTLRGSQESHAEILKQAGFVDQIVSRNELNGIFIEKFGKNKDADSFVAVGLKRYLHDIRPMLPSTENNIGLIVASGTIVGGEGTPSQMGAKTISDLINQAGNDKSLKALVIRVDSGGGSAFASEVIRDEIAAVRKKGLPVYISMGSVAASGGYWIATEAEEVWATPSTITGSIGVFSLVPNITDSMEKLGIHSDGIGTTDIADIYQINRPLAEEAKVVFQSGVDNIYRKFLSLVANAREMEVEDVHKIAQGRVWIGEKAFELGLVDQLGSLNDLMEYIAQKNDITSYSVKQIVKPLTPFEQFMHALSEQANTLGSELVAQKLNAQFGGMEKLIQTPEFELLLQNAEIRSGASSYYARCLGCIAP